MNIKDVVEAHQETAERIEKLKSIGAKLKILEKFGAWTVEGDFFEVPSWQGATSFQRNYLTQEQAEGVVMGIAFSFGFR